MLELIGAGVLQNAPTRETLICKKEGSALLGVLVLPLAVEVKADVDIDVVDEIGHYIIVFAVGEELAHPRRAGVPVRIVPNDAAAAEKIERNVVEFIHLFARIDLFAMQLFISDGGRAGNVEEEIAGEDPVVGIAAANAEVAVFNLMHLHTF